MTLSEYIAAMSSGAFLATMTAAEILAFSIQMVGLVVLLPAIAIFMGSTLRWMFKTVTHPDFKPFSLSGPPVPIIQAKVQLARLRTGRTTRLAKQSALIGLACIITGAIILAFFTDGSY